MGGMGIGVPNNGFGYGGDGLTAFPGTPGPPNVTGDQPAAYAGVFNGDILVDGTQFSDVTATRIDHPLDPANKYLIHTSVQSSEMMNIYSGNATTNELGLATVTLPEWFETENGDFRYQLTVIGGRFAQAIVSKEIADHQFTISTNASNIKVSWQITAVRQDAYAKSHPMRVEVTKSDRQRGYYAHPELYGQPEEKQTEWGRNPQLMQRVKAQREASGLRQTKREQSVSIRPPFGPPASAVDRQFALTPRSALKPIAEGRP
jgi:trimeric autotransporter adhesin